MTNPASYRPKAGEIPTQPGVYRFRDARGRVIYVGKAKNLRARLSSYFQDLGNLHPRTATMVTTAAGVEWTVVNDRGRGAAARVLLDQGVRPALQRQVPRRQVLPVARGHRRRGVPAGDGRPRRRRRAPATSARTATPGRSARPSTCCCGSSRCDRARNGVFKRSEQIGRPCLLGYIDKCSAPCVGKVSAEEHREIVDDFCDFMAGNTTPSSSGSAPRCTWPARSWTSRRRRGCATTSAPSRRRWRSRPSCSATAPTPTSSPSREDPLEVAVQIFHVRGGRIRGERGWVADRVDEGGTAELVENFLLQLYAGADDGDVSRARSSCPCCRPTPTT